MTPEPESRSVAGIAYRQGMLFVARRIPGGPIGGLWEFPGGKVESGEDDQAALKREYLEEFGIPVRVGPCLASASFFHNGKNRRLTAYRVDFDRDDFILREHTEWRWVSLEEAAELELADSDRKLLSGLRETLQ